MVQMRGAHDMETVLFAQFFGKLSKDQQERHRIGAAGECDGHTSARREQAVSAERAPD